MGIRSKEIVKVYYCDFCGKDGDQARKLIAGAVVCICNECVHLCVEMLNAPTEPNPPIQTQPDTHPQNTNQPGRT